MTQRHKQFLKIYNIKRPAPYWYDTVTTQIRHRYGTLNEVFMLPSSVFSFYTRDSVCLVNFPMLSTSAARADLRRM